MLKKIYTAVLLPLLFSMVAVVSTVPAENGATSCITLEKKASGDMARYSLHGEANGLIFFSGIRCAVKHRNKELCAMEMVSFDSTSKVFDYRTGDEIDVGKAFFWIDGENNEAPILAFSSRGSAEQFASEKTGGKIVDYTGLTEMSF